MKAIYKREMRAYFSTPIGYLVVAVMLLLLGMNFVTMYSNSYSNMSYVFSGIAAFAVLVVPVITMRLLSEDKKQKVDQALLTAPVKLWKIVSGKFLAALTLYMLPFASTLIYQVILLFTIKSEYGEDPINWLIYISSLLGVVLMGMAIIAIGLFISALTESQIIAGILTLGVSYFIIQLDQLAQYANNVGWLSEILTYATFTGKFFAFVSGRIDLSNCIFFISITLLFLFLTNVVLDRKRWA